MKLLWCDDCKSVVQIKVDVWIKCACGKIGGQYNEDNVTATIGGETARVFGIANPFFAKDFWEMPMSERLKFRYKWYPEGDGSDCWWGDYKGDVQLFHVKSPDGPRLQVKTKLSYFRDSVIVKVIGNGQDYWIAGKKNKKMVKIPASRGVKLTETGKLIGDE